MRWLKLSDYDKVVAFEKQACYHYVHGDNEAWINADTNMPVAYKNSRTIYSYKFNDFPNETLKLPPDYQKAWDKVQQMMSRLRRLSRPPLANG